MIMALLTTVGGTLIVLSPFAFLFLDDMNVDWARLANIGQAYGSISVLLSALALAGVAGSLIMQRRQSNIARIAIQRDQHWTLLRMAMEDPALHECWGATSTMTDGDEERRQMIYVNMILTHWHNSLALGTISEGALREVLADLFAGSPARIFWGRFYDYRRRAHAHRSLSAFDAIADDEYHRATSEAPR